jgi:phosphoribosyl-dephospho-CoA transferase
MEVNVHDLLTVHSSTALRSEDEIPDWVHESVNRTQRVVVRRADMKDGLIPVGVRGAMRHQRYAAYLSSASVTGVVTPVQLVTQASWNTNASKDNQPLFLTLNSLASYYRDAGVCWGLAGSVGFELASGSPVVHSGSDIDIVIYATQPVEKQTAALWNQFHQQFSFRVDALLETLLGACSLSEYASVSSRILLRTKRGPRLVNSPWSKLT